MQSLWGVRFVIAATPPSAPRRPTPTGCARHPHGSGFRLRRGRDDRGRRRQAVKAPPIWRALPGPPPAQTNSSNVADGGANRPGGHAGKMGRAPPLLFWGGLAEAIRRVYGPLAARPGLFLGLWAAAVSIGLGSARYALADTPRDACVVLAGTRNRSV